MQEISSQYLKQLHKQMKQRQATPYDMAHASFRKNNADCIIKSVDYKNLVITFLDGTTEKFKKSKYKLFQKYKSNLNFSYKVFKKAYIKRYFAVVNKFNKRHKKNTIGSIMSI